MRTVTLTGNREQFWDPNSSGTRHVGAEPSPPAARGRWHTWVPRTTGNATEMAFPPERGEEG